MQPVFIAGTDTGVGKTIVSSIVVEALKADYWKPVQAGDLNHTDSHCIEALISNPESRIHPEAFRLKEAISPHAAAAHEEIKIKLESLSPPKTKNILVIEGSGGLMSPLSENVLNIDLIGHLNATCLLVSKNCLGSINHSLLSLEALNTHSIPLLGIVFNGPSAPESEEYIQSRLRLSLVLRVNHEQEFTKRVIRHYADTFLSEGLFDKTTDHEPH